MSKNDVPAGGSGGPENVIPPVSGADGVVLPERLRVHALARLLSISSRQVLAALEDLGSPARSAQSGVDRETALRVMSALGIGAPTADAVATEPAVAAEPAATDTAVVDTAVVEPEAADVAEPVAAQPRSRRSRPAVAALTPVFNAPAPVFLPPVPPAEARPASTDVEEPVTDAPVEASPRRRRGRRTAGAPDAEQSTPAVDAAAQDPADQHTANQNATTQDTADEDTADRDGARPVDDDEDDNGRKRRRRGRRGRGRGKGAEDGDDTEGSDDADDTDGAAEPAASSSDSDQDDDADDTESSSDGARRRRRRRRRKNGADDDEPRADDPPDTVVHVRESQPRAKERSSRDDEVQAVRGSTRLEAKRQRRRDGREAGRRRAPILSEAEFLARRESVDRTMVVREGPDRVEIAVLEDQVLVEHFIASSGSGSMVGNVYLGRVQNVLPSMEAAFVDIGRGRNAVLYAGEVDWDAAGLDGKARRIEQALSSGDGVLVQVTKDPVGHKGARLTTQISLPGRFLVYVPNGRATGISRKLPDTERKRLKDILKRILPEDASVIIRTASEGVSEEELARDVRRLQAQWEVIQGKADSRAKAPELLYEEPDLLVKVVRDLFTEDFGTLVVQGGDSWDTIEGYVSHVAPELMPRAHRHTAEGDVFAEYRVDEQITKALDRKVWLPSGGYLIIDRTEAMTVIDVNTGKYTGSGGNLEETVTRNNLEAAEEIIRQLRLRDIGGIIVIDFIDMVLEANRDLVVRRLTECLGRDRTRHQVAEVTSLGLVQMTRKKVGTGLLEAYSTPCEHCKGRGVVVSSEPLVGSRANRSGGGNGNGNGGSSNGSGAQQNGSQRPGRGARDAEPAPAPAEVAEAPVNVDAADEPEPTSKRSRRSRSRRSSPDAVAVDAEVVPEVTASAAESAVPESVVPEPAASESTVSEPTGSESAATESAAPESAAPESAAPQPEAPAVPRTRRRRAAVRPAGAAKAADGGTAEPSVVVVADVPPASDTGLSAPDTGSATPDTSDAPVEQPAVTTTTRRRRRAVSRPAGPPVGEETPTETTESPVRVG